MAHLVPDDLTQLALSGAHAPELETLAELAQRLPDAYTVFHGVHWTRQYKGRTLYGEIDFIVMELAGAVLCIEQKNGPLNEDAGRLIKHYGISEKDVGAQIHRAIDNLRGKFAEQAGPGARIAVEYLIYCPDHALKRLSAVGLDAERIVDARARAQLAAQIQRILPAADGPTSGQSERVEAFLRQCFEVVADVHAHIDAQQRTYTRLSHGLREVLANLRMTPLRLQVLATAGNGKTLVAQHFYERALNAGKRPLLLCFNRPLAERLRNLVRTGGWVDTWYGFCDHFLQTQGVQLDYNAMHGNPDFWLAAARQLEAIALAETPTGDWHFDTLIVDEAQDFEEAWFQALRLFLPNDADILWLEDPNQNVRGADALGLQAQGFVGYRSLHNYRSPASIACAIQQALPEFAFIAANDLPGLGVGVTLYEDPADQPRLAGRLIGRLLSQRFRLQDIVILSCRGVAKTAFADIERVGNRHLKRFTNTYDLLGNQVYSAGQILFETVRRFKGQQAPAVILTDVDPRAERLAQELQVLFCGMTRATVRLEMLCKADNPVVVERLLPMHSGALR
jgi:hypothetical protein